MKESVQKERLRFLAAIKEGLADADAGRVHSHAEIKRRIKQRFGKNKRE